MHIQDKELSWGIFWLCRRDGENGSRMAEVGNQIQGWGRRNKTPTIVSNARVPCRIAS